MTSLPHRLLPFALGLSSGLTSCTPTAPPPSDAPQIDLTIYDSQGLVATRDSVPQWPAFELSDVPFDEDLPLYIIQSELNADLVDDLAALPLRQSNVERSVDFLSAPTNSGTLLWPTSALTKGERYVVALLPGQATRTILPNKEPFAMELAISSDPSAGASLLSSLPVDQQRGVDPSTRSLRLGFDGKVDDCALISVRTDREAESVDVSAKRLGCNSFDDRAASCCVITLNSALSPGTGYLIELDQISDSHGAPVVADTIRFETAANGASTAPRFIPLTCALDEQSTELGVCVSSDDESLALHLLLDQPAIVTAHVGDQTRRLVATRAEAQIRFTGLQADHDYDIKLKVEGTSSEREAFTLQARTAVFLPTLSISEVLADPLGSEPQQEYVEIWNYGAAPIQLDELLLSDDAAVAGQAISSTLALSPGARALLVANDYDPDDGVDPAPAPGVPLIRVGKSLAKSGLANRGEPLFLRDVQYHRLSASPVLKVDPGQCLRRLPQAPPRAGAASDFTTGLCTPGE